MASTTIDMPDSFNVEIINKVIGSEKYDKNSFTHGELLDIWGFLKVFESDGKIEVSENCINTFERLCENVTENDLRYNLNGERENPYRMAVHCSKSDQANDDMSYDNVSRGKRSINLNREQEQRKPAYAIVEESSSYATVVIDTDSVEIKDSEICVPDGQLSKSDIFDNPDDYSNPEIKQSIESPDSMIYVHFNKQ